MLTHSFIHLPGIGVKTEEKLWQAGCYQWDQWQENVPVRLPNSSLPELSQLLERSAEELDNGPGFFSKRLPSNEQWRLFSHFRDRTAYLDIETTGLGVDAEVTTIALYDGDTVRCYVNGRNLEAFETDVWYYDILVTYNGKSFDIPFLERWFRTRLPHAQIDLRYVLANLGFTGGLKGCEKQLVMNRGVLDGAMVGGSETRERARRKASGERQETTAQRADLQSGPSALQQAIPVATVVLLCAVSFLRVMGESAPQAFFTVYLDTELQMPAQQIGVLVGIGRLLAAPAGLLMPLLASRWGNGRVIVAGALGVAVSLLPLSLIPHWTAAGLGYMSLTAMAAVARAAFIVYSMESVAPRWQSTLSALTTMAASVSRMMTSLVAGYTVAVAGYRGTFLTGAAVTAVGAMLFWAAFCRKGCRPEGVYRDV